MLKRFKNNEIKVLVVNDVPARGLDVSDITHVINYSLPQSYFPLSTALDAQAGSASWPRAYLRRS